MEDIHGYISGFDTLDDGAIIIMVHCAPDTAVKTLTKVIVSEDQPAPAAWESAHCETCGYYIHSV